MESKIYWLFSFVGLYWAYCIFWGIKGARTSKTSEDYFVAGRSIGTWVFVLAATATSFSGWTFVGHPGKILTDGLPYAFASFYALTIPFTGVLFLRRQWVLGRAFNYITPGEMYSDYYGGNAIRGLTVLVAFLFSVPYLGIQLRASGALFNVLTDGMVSTNMGMILLSTVVVICVYVAHRHRGEPQVDDLPARTGKRKLHRGQLPRRPGQPANFRDHPRQEDRLGIRRIRARGQRFGLLASPRRRASRDGEQETGRPQIRWAGNCFRFLSASPSPPWGKERISRPTSSSS